MTTTADYVPLLTEGLRKLSVGQWREGDVVFFYAPGKGQARAQAGYAVLASATERYAFDPYVEAAFPVPEVLPPGVQLWYHSSVPVDPKQLHLDDVLALLWATHRKAVVGKEALLITHGVISAAAGEVLLQERLDGYLSLDVHGQEVPYPAPKRIKRRLLPAKQQRLVQHPFVQQNLLRLVATDPKRIRFLSR